MGFAEPALRLRADQYRVIVAHCYDGLPDEACGLLIGPINDRYEATGEIVLVHPCRNADESARTYTVDSADYHRADQAAREAGAEIVGVWHSHTHTDAYPSMTDVKKAADPGWLYAIVSLKDGEPVLRSYRIRAGETDEVDVELID